MANLKFHLAMTMTNVKLSVRNTASCIQAQSCPDSGTQPQTSVSNERRRLGLRLLPWLRFCPSEKILGFFSKTETWKGSDVSFMLDTGLRSNAELEQNPIGVMMTTLAIQPIMIVQPTATFAGEEDESQHLAWHAVASWTWDAQDETCGICRMAFDGCCPDCKLPGDVCPLIWGACNHAFHLHCILKWVNSQTSQAHCPMCRREWQFKG
ncbi:unnamed protein product [Prunus armeniaca]|uniref:Anaphase-promoting complex subunit 11 n=1 Tax=Prunus armeniaca TaxID=36596 RepID=A0A6J5VA43_PRUAR|nr:unnamed protein product [Prunus armeniaca]